MEEFWDNSGPYALAKLADRLVPVPRDTEPPVSLYALCRAWVRNNPSLPLSVDGPSPVNREAKDAPARLSNPVGPSSSNGDGAQPASQQQREPEAQTGSLLSILPAVLPPTALETETQAPTYPLDDFEPQEPEEAQRKLKDHWVSVRQYHQAVLRAKRSRCSERLRVLLGEPSSLQQQQQQLPQLPTQQLQLQLALQQQQQLTQHPLAGMVSGQALNGGPLQGLQGLPGALLVAGGLAGPAGITPGLAAGVAAGVDARGGPPPGPTLGMPGAPVNLADAQAALAMLAALGQVPVLPTAVDSAAQQQPLPQEQPQPPQQMQQPDKAGGMTDLHGQTQQPQELLVNGVAPAMDVLLSLQQPQQQQQLNQLPQVAGLAQPIHGELQNPQDRQQQLTGLASAVPQHDAAVMVDGVSGHGASREGVEHMEIDSRGQNGGL